MTHSLSSDLRVVRLEGLSPDYSLDCSIDKDGDLLIERNDMNDFMFIPANQLQRFRDWLNEVLP